MGEALAGRGSLVLLAGEAGVGKTHLAEAALDGAPVLRGAAAAPRAGAYGPVLAALRSRLRREPGALDGAGPLRAHLAVLLPELGEPAETSDRATLFEAVRTGLELLAPAVVLLDDLQWSDEATLELLAALAAPLRELPMLVVGAYRSDEVGRGHPLRRLRADLRRARLLRELTVAPLDAAASADAGRAGARRAALAARWPPRCSTARRACRSSSRSWRARWWRATACAAAPHGLELAHDGDVPVPETIRDAVLLRTAGLSAAGRAAAEAAAVTGSEFALDLAPGLDELLETGLIAETEDGRATFRHALVRGAIYEDIQWRRRRELHWSHAERLTASGAPEHRDRRPLARRRGARARRRRLPGRRAASWSPCTHTATPPRAALRGARPVARGRAPRASGSRALQLYAYSAEIAGDLAEAVRALREVAARAEDGADARHDRTAARRRSTSSRATASGR